jgi:hypothetical protein
MIAVVPPSPARDTIIGRGSSTLGPGSLHATQHECAPLYAWKGACHGIIQLVFQFCPGRRPSHIHICLDAAKLTTQRRTKLAFIAPTTYAAFVQANV